MDIYHLKDLNPRRWKVDPGILILQASLFLKGVLMTKSSGCHLLSRRYTAMCSRLGKACCVETILFKSLWPRHFFNFCNDACAQTICALKCPLWDIDAYGTWETLVHFLWQFRTLWAPVHKDSWSKYKESTSWWLSPPSAEDRLTLSSWLRHSACSVATKMETVDRTPLHKILRPSNTALRAQMNIRYTSSKYSTSVDFFPTTSFSLRLLMRSVKWFSR